MPQRDSSRIVAVTASSRGAAFLAEPPVFTGDEDVVGMTKRPNKGGSGHDGP